MHAYLCNKLVHFDVSRQELPDATVLDRRFALNPIFPFLNQSGSRLQKGQLPIKFLILQPFLPRGFPHIQQHAQHVSMEDAQVQGCVHVMLDGLDLHATKVCVPFISKRSIPLF